MTSQVRDSALLDRLVWCLLLGISAGVFVLDFGSVALDAVPYPSSRHRDAVGIDPLTARRADLQLLPDVGPGLARVIHEAARAGRLRDLDELETLRGIGPTRAGAIRNAITGPGHD